MKKQVKAALLSALVFPGTGHFSLNRYQRGMIFFVPAIMSFVFLVHNALSKAFALVDQIERGEIPADPEVISRLISAAPDGSEFLMLQMATWTLMACWIIGIIDSYRLGKMTDHTNRT